MSEVLQTNIFFFITSIAVIVCTFLLSILLYHLIRVMKSVRTIIERVETESEAIADDIERLRVYITEESFLSRFFTSRRHHSEEEKKDVSHKSSRRFSTDTRKGAHKSRTELHIKNEE